PGPRQGHHHRPRTASPGRVDPARLVAARPARPASDFAPRDPRAIVAVRSVRARRDRVEVSAEDDRGGVVPIEIRPVAPNIVRLHFGAGPARQSRLLVDDAPSATDWTMSERADGWSVATPSLTLEIDRAPIRLRLKDAAGSIRFCDEPNDRDLLGGFHHFPTGHARGLRWLTAGLQPDEALFGLGEHFGALNRRGQAFASWTVDAFGVRIDRAYKHVPRLLRSAGYGVFCDSTRPLYYDLGQASGAAWQ